MAFVTVCVNESLMGCKGRRGQCLQLPAAATYSAYVCCFTQETGIAVNAVYAKTGMLERLRSEGRNSPADLVFTVDIGRLTDPISAGLTQPVESAALNANIPANFRDPDGHWFGLTARARLIVTSRKQVAAGEMTRYEQLAEPKGEGASVHAVCQAPLHGGVDGQHNRGPRVGQRQALVARRREKPGAKTPRQRPHPGQSHL